MPQIKVENIRAIFHHFKKWACCEKYRQYKAYLSQNQCVCFLSVILNDGKEKDTNGEDSVSNLDFFTTLFASMKNL